MRRFVLAFFGFTGILAGSLQAQRLSGNPFPAIEEPALAAGPSINPNPCAQVHSLLLAAGGILGGAVGAFGGGGTWSHRC